jgi:hypothetical protein
MIYGIAVMISYLKKKIQYIEHSNFLNRIDKTVYNQTVVVSVRYRVLQYCQIHSPWSAAAAPVGPAAALGSAASPLPAASIRASASTGTTSSRNELSVGVERPAITALSSAAPSPVASQKHAERLVHRPHF